MFTLYLQQAASDYGIVLTQEQLEAFNRYYQLLVEWNEKMNLTAITEPQEVAVKHIIDSLSCYHADFFLPKARVVDVGTGAGFPGIPLKIYRPDLQLTLVDSLNKRLTFLQCVITELGLKDVTVVHARAEEGARKKELREKYDVALSRAVARLNVLSELCLPFVAVGGCFIALKGAQYEEEANEARQAVSLLGGKLIKTQPVKLPGLDDKRAVLYIQKEKSTPGTYPRKPGTPEKKPL